MQSLGVELQRGNRVPVGLDLSVEGHPEVFAVGDIAWITDKNTERDRSRSSARSRSSRASARARTSRGSSAGKETEPFDYNDKGTMATIGRGAAVVQFKHGRTMKGKSASLAWGTVHLALLSTGEDRAKAVVDWTWAGLLARAARPDQRGHSTSASETSGGDDRQRRGQHDERSTDTKPADVLVIFGITGDLASVMTFHSLYRLEQRGLLDCPIVGVAFDDWTLDQLKQRARDSIVATGEQLDEAVFERFAARLSYVHGDFADAATYGRVADAIKGFELPVFYLEIPPFLFGKVVAGPARRRA